MVRRARSSTVCWVSERAAAGPMEPWRVRATVGKLAGLITGGNFKEIACGSDPWRAAAGRKHRVLERHHGWHDFMIPVPSCMCMRLGLRVRLRPDGTAQCGSRRQHGRRS